MPVLLRLQRVRRTAQAPCRRLLRVLLLRIGAVPADTDQHALLRAGGSLRSRSDASPRVARVSTCRCVHYGTEQNPLCLINNRTVSGSYR
jgi:hypothetical protein